MASGYRRQDMMATISRFALCGCVVATLVLSAWSASFEAKEHQRRAAIEANCEGPDCLGSVPVTTKVRTPSSTEHKPSS